MASSRRSQSEYDRRMHAVIEYIDRHLDQNLDLAALAGVAHFSAFHFHRLFHAWMGEPLGDYVRRRRLEVAAMRLRAQPRIPVLQMALAVGFGSAEAFTRAFRARFGCSPTGWRKSKCDQVTRKPDQAANASRAKNGDSSTREFDMKVTLMDREPVQVAYLRRTGPYGPGITQFWMDTVAPWMATNNLFGRARFGISLDDPHATRAAQCRYDACVEVAKQEPLAGDAKEKVIPGGKYAVLEYDGPIVQIGKAWDHLLGQWLPQSGLQLDSRPMFEHYPVDGRFDEKTGRITCEICVPVTALTQP
ncbi:MAG: GyrI-like domain-containing protein [Pseudomonadota bacterium]